jgi:hypothetical protein
LALAWGGPAWAVSPEEAEALAADIAAALARPVPTMPDLALTTSEPVRVVIAGDGYDATMPNLTLVESQAGVVAEIGTVTLRLVPDAANPDRMAISGRLGSDSITVTAEGEPAARITIGDHQFQGTWSQMLLSFINLNAKIGSVRIVPLDPEAEQGSIDLGAIAIAIVSTDVAPGKVDMDMRADISDFSVTIEGERPAVMQRITVSEAIEGLDLAAYSQFAAEMRAVTDQMTPTADPTQAMQDMVNALLRMPKIASGGYVEWTIDGLEINADGEHMQLDHHLFHLGISGLDQANATLGLDVELAGLVVPPGEVPAEMVPQAFDMGIEISQLPTAALFQVFGQGLAGADFSDPMAMEMMGQMLGMQLMGVIMQAGTKLALDGSIDWDISDIAYNGEFTADPTAMMQSTGFFDLAITNMQALAARISSLSGDQNAAAGLAMIQAIGNQETAGNGDPLTRFKIELLPDGRTLLNGQDLEPLIGAMMMGGEPGTMPEGPVVEEVMPQEEMMPEEAEPPAESAEPRKSTK